MTCVVAPARAKEEKSSGKEKMTIWTEGKDEDVAGDGVEAAIGEAEPHATANRLAANRTVRSRFISCPLPGCILHTQSGSRSRPLSIHKRTRQSCAHLRPPLNKARIDPGR
jgi:hypothetical protein